MSAWAALRTMADDRGWPLTLLYVMHRGLQALSGDRWALVPYALVAQPIGVGSGSALREDLHTVVRVLTAQDPLCSDLPRPPAINHMRWAQGAKCYVIEVKGQFGGTIWIQRGAYVEDEVRCRFILARPDISAWDFDVYIEPKLRLGRTMARLWNAVDKDLAGTGVQWTFSRISLFNAASMQSHARLGARRVGWACFLKAERLQVAFLPSWPYLHAGLAEDHVPSLKLHPPE